MTIIIIIIITTIIIIIIIVIIIKNKQTHKQKTPKSNKNVKEKDPIKRKRQKN